MADIDKELELRSAKSIRIYGGFLGNSLDDDLGGGYEDYSDPIELQGVRIVREDWLLNLVERNKAQSQEIIRATEIMAELLDGRDHFAPEEAREFIKKHGKGDDHG